MRTTKSQTSPDKKSLEYLSMAYIAEGNTDEQPFLEKNKKELYGDETLEEERVERHHEYSFKLRTYRTLRDHLLIHILIFGLYTALFFFIVGSRRITCDSKKPLIYCMSMGLYCASENARD